MNKIPNPKKTKMPNTVYSVNRTPTENIPNIKDTKHKNNNKTAKFSRVTFFNIIKVSYLIKGRKLIRKITE